ncbi:MAG: hypothetical protein IID30_15085 [Planctomycetes bacterium]|nr:hypothetical protein [Planctomycetota bacterium]
MKHPPSSRRLFLYLLPWFSVFISGGRFLAAQTPPACQQTKLVLPAAVEDEQFGSDVELNNDFLFVAKDPNNPFNLIPGGVHIFQPGLTPNTWFEVQLLPDPDPSLPSEFGVQIDVSNDSLIVLASGDDGATNRSGAAYIFRFDVALNTWVFEAKIFASDLETLGSLGPSGDVSINGDIAILGSPSHAHGGIDSGAAHVFRFDGTAWNEEAELLAGDRSSLDGFGRSVALVGNIAIVGAANDDDLGAGSGSVYVFKKVAGSWIQVGKITAPDGAAGDLFGVSVDFDGITLAIGAVNHDYGEPDIGAVYLFQDNGLPGWEFITKLTPPPNGDGRNDEFGAALDIDGDRLAIGASGIGEDKSAHVYRKTDGIWNYKRRMISYATLPGSTFSRRITLHDDTLVVGSAFDRQLGGFEIGAAYVQSNIFRTDCNANCISDTEEIAADPALDCNLNGILDVCDLTDGVTLDCNLNGIPDECEDCDNNGIADECDLNPRYSQGSGSLSPIGLGSDANFIFTALPTRLSDVTFDFTASAELAGTSFIEVFLNSVKIGEVFNAAGTGCADPPDEDQIILPQSTFETIVGSGDADVLMTAFLDPFACSSANFVTVTMSFFTPLLIDIDTNDNGIIDTCECPADCANGTPDGNVNVTDLLALLANWGGTPTFCDIAPPGGDGTVNVTDLLALLGAWGACSLP